MKYRGLSAGAVLAGAAVVGVKVVASAPQLPGQMPVVAITWVVVVSFVVIGLVLLATEVHPANGWGCILVALATVPGDLNDPHLTGSLLSAVGFVLEPLYLVAAVALVLRYPRGRLSTAAGSLVGSLLIVGFVSRAATAASTGDFPDDFFRPRQWSTLAIPAVWHDEVFVRGGRTVSAILLIAVAFMLANRLRRASGLSRQSQAPLVVIGLVCALAAAVDQMVWAAGTPVLRQVPAALVRNLSAGLLPVAILGDLLRRKVAVAAVSQRILTAAMSGSATQLQDAVREVFVDRTATVELADGRGGWVDASARPVEECSAGAGRLSEFVELDDEVLLRIVLDPRVIQDEALLRSAVAAVRVGTQNTRLHADLLAALSDLRDSRERIVEASLAERRRVERNLHDGAQQQFLAVAATLARTDLVGDERLREVVGEARRTLGDALAELRNLARGIHPAILSQGGLPGALSSLCDRAAWPVELIVDPKTMDLRETVKGAAYFVVAELLTNVAKHAQASNVEVRAQVVGDDIVVLVADDGIGGANLVAGGGLAGLNDRVQALGGNLSITEFQPPLNGTTVVATLPTRVKEMP